jgi:hypothetical protein
MVASADLSGAMSSTALASGPGWRRCGVRESDGRRGGCGTPARRRGGLDDDVDGDEVGPACGCRRTIADSCGSGTRRGRARASGEAILKETFAEGVDVVDLSACAAASRAPPRVEHGVARSAEHAVAVRRSSGAEARWSTRSRPRHLDRAGCRPRCIRRARGSNRQPAAGRRHGLEAGSRASKDLLRLLETPTGPRPVSSPEGIEARTEVVCRRDSGAPRGSGAQANPVAGPAALAEARNRAIERARDAATRPRLVWRRARSAACRRATECGALHSTCTRFGVQPPKGCLLKLQAYEKAHMTLPSRKAASRSYPWHAGELELRVVRT